MNPLIQLSTGPFTPKGISDSFPFPVGLCGSNRLLVRKTFLQTILTVVISVLAPIVAYADSATWDLNPGSGDWNTAANWTPMTVPNASTDTAIFDLSHRSNISVSADTQVNSIVFDSGATSPFTITASPGFTLTLSGTGITNNSGTTQNFATAVNGAGSVGLILFKNTATAGSETSFTNNGSAGFFVVGGQTQFFDTATASNGTFTNNGGTAFSAFGGQAVFKHSSTASNGTINNNGGTAFSAFGGQAVFKDSSTAGNATIKNNGATVSLADGGSTHFFNTSTAGSATINNNGGGRVSGAFGGFTRFLDTSTAGNATINNNGATVSGAFEGITEFEDTSTAGNATINNNGATVSSASGGTGGGITIFGSFGGTSTAGNATINNNGGTVSGALEGRTGFGGTSTAGNATINNNGATVSGANGGSTFFGNISTAGSATLIASGGRGGGAGGSILFSDDSTGGTARVEVFGNGNLDISFHGPPGVTVGSIEGTGNVFLGYNNNLTVGSNNMSTTFSGVIRDGGANGGINGSLTKIGSGTLILSGANTYTGNTNINGGVLQVDGSINSNTGVHGNGTLAGTGTINGNVTNNGIVSPGDAPGTLTVGGNYTQLQFATLMIQIAGANDGQFSVLDVLGNANLDGFLDPVLLNGFTPTIGESFTFLNYASLTGAFSRIQNQVFDNGMLQWSVIYQNNNAILTVGPNTIPDQGSTFLLLMASILGLVMYRRQLLRGQS
jgi:Passenger-associated-transport-repeat/VPDSG-CTERM motif